MSWQCKEGGFPHDLWLSVSAENVSVYKRGEPKPLETFPYEHIIFFGAPQPCTYKITVDEREMFFETPQVHMFVLFVFISGSFFSKSDKTFPDKEESVPLNLNITFLVQLLKINNFHLYIGRLERSPRS